MFPSVPSLTGRLKNGSGLLSMFSLFFHNSHFSILSAKELSMEVLKRWWKACTVTNPFTHTHLESSLVRELPDRHLAYVFEYWSKKQLGGSKLKYVPFFFHLLIFLVWNSATTP